MNGLKSILVEQGRKKQWLAAATGISIKTLSRYLSGQTRPSSAWLDAAARVLGCDPEDLLPMTTDRTPARDRVGKSHRKVA